MSDLKDVLFRRTWVALTAYLDADKKLDEFKDVGPGFDGLKRIRHDRFQRFSALWELIEEAGLEGEYETWKMATAAADMDRAVLDGKEADANGLAETLESRPYI